LEAFERTLNASLKIDCESTGREAGWRQIGHVGEPSFTHWLTHWKGRWYSIRRQYSSSNNI